MTATIYERGQRRESNIWSPFLWNGPFSAVHDAERAVMYGIYAYTYLQGHNYLVEIETEDLARLVDTYNSNIAGITTDEAKLVIEVAGKRYLQSIESLLHIEKKAAREREIDALDDEYDARIEALEADRDAIATKEAEVQLAIDRTALKIEQLEIDTEIEGVKQSLIDVEIAEKEIEALRVDLRILEVGLEGLNIQLAITQVALDMTNTDLQIVNAENDEAEMDVRISEVGIQTTEEGIRADNVALDEIRSAAEEQRLISRFGELDVRIAQADLDVEEAGFKQSEIESQTKNIEADTAKLGLIDSELVLAEANLRIQQVDNQTLLDQRDLIKSKGDNVEAETEYYVDYQTVQEELDAKLNELEQTKSNAERERMEQTVAQKEDFGNIERTQELPSKKDIADEKYDVAIVEAEAKEDLDVIKYESAEDKKDAAIQAAHELAEANIVNTLTHSLGSA